MITEHYTSGNENYPNENPLSDNNERVDNQSESMLEEAYSHQDEEHLEQKSNTFALLSLEAALDEMEKIINGEVNFSTIKKFNQLKEVASQRMQTDKENALNQFLAAGNEIEHFEYLHPQNARMKDICLVQKEKMDEFQKQVEAEQEENKKERKTIIDDLHKLYTEATTDTNLFKEIRIIKERWSKAGQVPKSDFKILNNDYFFHLNQFYQVLDLNKEFLEQEYAHNLEKRQHIIQRTKELIEEPSIQKALNELQYLHKLWKEEAVPVAEEHREPTWEEFKAVSAQIHDRKAELVAQQEAEQKENLLKKNAIIEEIKKLTFPVADAGHTYWQNAIEKVEQLRENFIKIGSVPKKLSSENWNLFKTVAKEFNHEKNKFYKNLKNRQHENLEAKKELLKKAKENALATDWETLLPMYKQLQEDWRKIGHVPKSVSQKLWNEFKDACNTFFNNYRTHNEIKVDNWKENFIEKQKILDRLKALEENENTIADLEQIKTDWERWGKVPRDKMKINNEFSQLYKKWAKKLNIQHESSTAVNPIDRARKLKVLITDVENQIVTLENNLSFFSDSSRENPLLKDTYQKIDAKKQQLEEMKQELREILRTNEE